MKEIVVLSGKGGTGKTTLLGSFALLADNKVMADCDVDAADLHLLLAPIPRKKNKFHTGVKARVIKTQCTSCGTCKELCQFGAVSLNGSAAIDPFACEGCGVCAHFCPEEAIVLDENYCGNWFISDTDYGVLVHAQLFAGEENSGKLVTFIKKKARELAEQQSAESILVDGSPGIGCPVIASLSNVDAILAVTEPTQSGWHDLERVLELADHFKIQSFVCLNKWDLNPGMAEEIVASCQKRRVDVLGYIPFDPAVVSSQLAGVPFGKDNNGPAALAIREIWKQLHGKVIGGKID
ncbi:MAG: ATP-binding protein [Desulfobacteraceae bacterium]|nr:ATP-binding protein [Actinomycetota bacterium]MBU4259864.1 ATP-binding protein [Pseudomonadota bacterium]MCG2829686.1 ATP-binding protein [Desulfobacteraceae bacterium]